MCICRNLGLCLTLLTLARYQPTTTHPSPEWVHLCTALWDDDVPKYWPQLVRWLKGSVLQQITSSTLKMYFTDKQSGKSTLTMAGCSPQPFLWVLLHQTNVHVRYVRATQYAFHIMFDETSIRSLCSLMPDGRARKSVHANTEEQYSCSRDASKHL